MNKQTRKPMPRFRRADQTPAMRFQDRDAEILQSIFEFDGVMIRRHLKQLFWPTSSKTAMEARLSKLYHNNYLDWPNAEQRRVRPIPEPLVWLGWRGIVTLAGSRGVQVKYPAKDNENQMRLLQSRLRKSGIRWVREPNWNQPLHEIAVADFRLSLARAMENTPHLELEQWIPESVFRANTDVVQFNFLGRNGESLTRSKGVIPDGFFVIKDQKRAKRGKPHRALFLLEIDMATHDNLSFGLEKAAVGAAYIKSKEYRNRFDSNSGRWLIVTTSDVRLNNLKDQIETRAGRDKNLFYLTTANKVLALDSLTDDIWQTFGRAMPVSLLAE